MGRVDRQPVGLVPAGGHAAVRHNEQLKKTKPEYKIQMEQVTQRKKKLLAMTTYKVQAPPGYTFIPLTAPDLTDKCKDLSRQKGVQVHVVSTSKGGKHSTELSKQVGRVGHHFPSQVVSQALAELGYDIDRSGRILSDLQQFAKTVGNEASRRDQKGTRIGDGITDPSQLKKAQEQLNAEASQCLGTLFPNMPEKDKKAVIKHAFVIGKDRIGSSAELSMDRRVHLAVLAHIRHTYTNYDKLLKEVPYQTARSIVEQKTLQKIVEWRGEGDNDEAVEEILREVIVIDDDDDEPDVAHVSLVDDDDEEIQFRSSPIAADKVESRPHFIVHGNQYELSQASREGPGYHVLDGAYQRMPDMERQRRYDDRRRTAWQEAKRSYREALPAPAGYVPARSHAHSNSNGTINAYGYNQVRLIPRDAIDNTYVEQTRIDGPSKPQVVVLSQPQVGAAFEPVRSYKVETGRRQTPDRHEVIHQSIEQSPKEAHRPMDRPEVIVLDSPVTMKPVDERFNHDGLDPSDRPRYVERLDRPHIDNVSFLNAGNRRKRTIDEMDPVHPGYPRQAPYANKIVQLSGYPHDTRIVQAPRDNLPQVRSVEYVQERQMVTSPRDANFGFQTPMPGQQPSNGHFYARPQAVAPINVSSRQPFDYVPTERAGRPTEVAYEARQHNPSMVVLSERSPQQHGFEAATARPVSVGSHFPEHQTVGQNTGTLGDRQRYIQQNAHIDPSGQQLVGRARLEDGVQQHLQKLHFYGAPRPAAHDPVNRFYDANGREIMVNRRTAY